jgi:acyl-CoA reductase-like NAD-dependent aldehyde dehydrogenase
VYQTVPCASEQQAEAAIAAAKAAFPSWSATPHAERRKVLDGIADSIDSNVDMLARALTCEQGKPLAEAEACVMFASVHIRYYADRQLLPSIIQDDDEYLVEVQRKPLGVVVGIVPWNFPLAIACNKMAMALATGNTFILKPAPTTPVTAILFGQLAKDIVPAGVLNVIVDNNDLGGFLSAHRDVAKVTFTGSTATGKKVMASGADTLKRLTLKLGGNDAAIVLPDVNVQETAAKIFTSAFMNCGQVCVAIKRAYVHESIYDDMCEEMAKLADEAIVGDGLGQGTQIGPLQNQAQYSKVLGIVEDASEHATIIAGGTRPDGPGYFLRPTIVRDIEDGARLVDEEQFGPVLPVIRYSDVEQAMTGASASEYGLGGSIWSKDRNSAKKLARRLETGTAWVNHHMASAPHIPFGGAKSSGVSVENGEEGLIEFTQIHVVNVAK